MRYKQRAHGALEHRLVMEELLGCRIPSGEVVHHRNLDKRDNRPENLVVMSASDHAALHNLIRWHGVEYVKHMEEYRRYL